MQKGPILIVILIGVFVLLFALPSWLSSSDEQKIEVANDIELIEIDSAGINTIIVPRKQKNIEAELDGKGSVTVKEYRDSIKVEYERKWFQPFSFNHRKKLTIYIPESYDRDMEIEVGSGNVSFDGKANAIQLKHLSLEAGSGNIQMESIAADKAVIEVHSGNVNIKQFIGQLEADVSSGNLIIEMDHLQGPLSADVSSGQLTLKLPKDADFTLNGQVSSGKISSDIPLKDKIETKDELKGIHGSGEHKINLDVSSGRIQIMN